MCGYTNMSYLIANNSFEIDNITQSSSDSDFIAWVIQANVLLAIFILIFLLILLLDFIHRKSSFFNK